MEMWQLLRAYVMECNACSMFYDILGSLSIFGEVKFVDFVLIRKKPIMQLSTITCLTYFSNFDRSRSGQVLCREIAWWLLSGIVAQKLQQLQLDGMYLGLNPAPVSQCETCGK